MKTVGFLSLFICLIGSDAVAKSSLSSSGWGYTRFPIVQQVRQDHLPRIVSIGRKKLRARFQKGAGTHPSYGVEQVYSDYSLKKYVLVKKNVRLKGGRSLLGGVAKNR